MKLFISIVLVLNIFLKKLIEQFPKKKFIEQFPKNFHENKIIKTNIFRIQFNNVWLLLHSIGSIDFMLAGKKLTDHTNLFSRYDFKKNDSIILSYFKNE